jgi:hypothetical protein
MCCISDFLSVIQNVVPRRIWSRFWPHLEMQTFVQSAASVKMGSYPAFAALVSNGWII